LRGRAPAARTVGGLGQLVVVPLAGDAEQGVGVGLDPAGLLHPVLADLGEASEQDPPADRQHLRHPGRPPRGLHRHRDRRLRDRLTVDGGGLDHRHLPGDAPELLLLLRRGVDAVDVPVAAVVAQPPEERREGRRRQEDPAVAAELGHQDHVPAQTRQPDLVRPRQARPVVLDVLAIATGATVVLATTRDVVHDPQLLVLRISVSTPCFPHLDWECNLRPSPSASFSPRTGAGGAPPRWPTTRPWRPSSGARPWAGTAHGDWSNPRSDVGGGGGSGGVCRWSARRGPPGTTASGAGPARSAGRSAGGPRRWRRRAGRAAPRRS